MTNDTTTFEHKNRGVFVFTVFAVLPIFLTAVFAILKFLDVIHWSWLQVLIPIWIALLGLLPIALATKLILKFIVKTGSKIP